MLKIYCWFLFYISTKMIRNRGNKIREIGFYALTRSHNSGSALHLVKQISIPKLPLLIHYLQTLVWHKSWNSIFIYCSWETSGHFPVFTISLVFYPTFFIFSHVFSSFSPNIQLIFWISPSISYNDLNFHPNPSILKKLQCWFSQ